MCQQGGLLVPPSAHRLTGELAHKPVTREGMLMRPGPEDTADALAVLERLAPVPPRRTGG